MEARLTAVEMSIVRIDGTLAGMREQMATKSDLADLRADMHKSLGEQTMRIITWATSVIVVVSGALVAAAYFIARNVH